MSIQVFDPLFNQFFVVKLQGFISGLSNSIPIVYMSVFMPIRHILITVAL